VGVAPRAITGVRCAVDDCDKPARGGGFCITHYRRQQKIGDPGGADLLRAKMGDGSVTDAGYRKIKLASGYEFEHRIVMERELGRPLRVGEQIHHLDGDRLNNDPANLELWSRYQPSGQRVADKVRAAIKLLNEYPAIAADEGYRLMPLESREATDFLLHTPRFRCDAVDAPPTYGER
jgi:hypothetical protein